jgi:tetratricopeptide (TPR) repeat protein
VRARNRSAAKLLQLCALLNPDIILLDFLEGIRSNDDLGRLLRNAVLCEEAIAFLERFSLVHRNIGARSVKIHRLIQSVVHDQMTSEALKSMWLLVIKRCTEVTPSSAYAAPNRWIEFESQVLPPLLKAPLLPSRFLLITLISAGVVLCQAGRFDQSITFTARAAELCRHLYGDVHDCTLFTLTELADRYFRGRRFSESVTVLDHLLTMESGHVEVTLRASAIKASVLQRQGHLSTAISQLEASLGSIRSQNSNRIQFYALYATLELEARWQLGIMYDQAGRFLDSSRMREEVIDQSRRVLGDGNGCTLSWEILVAWHYIVKLDNFDKAVDLSGRTMEKCERYHGNEKDVTHRCRQTLARIYLSGGRIEESVDLLIMTVAKRTELWGEGHILLYDSLELLADAYLRIGQREEAVKLVKAAMDIVFKHLGVDHAETTRIATKLDRIISGLETPLLHKLLIDTGHVFPLTWIIPPSIPIQQSLRRHRVREAFKLPLGLALRTIRYFREKPHHI